ncbi:hypothetical protein [Azospirillum sp. sgz301742]
MSIDPAALQRRAALIRERIQYMRGMADALESLSGLNDAMAPTAATPKSRNEHRPKRQMTLRPLLDILRENPKKRFAMSELIELARENGHDLLRPSVVRALDVAHRRGWVKLSRGGVQIVANASGMGALDDVDRLLALGKDEDLL